jgi:hypothetical protein
MRSLLDLFAPQRNMFLSKPICLIHIPISFFVTRAATRKLHTGSLHRQSLTPTAKKSSGDIYLSWCYFHLPHLVMLGYSLEWTPEYLYALHGENIKAKETLMKSITLRHNHATASRPRSLRPTTVHPIRHLFASPGRWIDLCPYNTYIRRRTMPAC